VNSKVRLFRNRILPVLVVLGLLAYQYYFPQESGVTGEDASGVSAVEAAFAAQRSGLWVETEGRVARLLADDNDGSRHQRFILELDGGHTVLVSHNIDLARRVPLDRHDLISLRGRYEWNERGGVIHWTHHDPQGHISGGWIRQDNVVYK
jgi:hypothetical protein